MRPAAEGGVLVTRPVVSLACALVAVAVLGSAADAQWITTNGPAGSTTRAFTFSAGGARLVAGTAGGGAFVATGHYESWLASNDGLLDPEILSLATGVNEFGGEVLLAGTEANGVFASWNHGQSWSAVNSGLANGTVLAVTAIPDPYFGFGMVLFAGTEGGVFRSNGGQSVLWTHRSGGLTHPTVRALVSVPGGDENDGIGARDLFAGTAGGVFLSTDGVTWLPKNAGLTEANVAALAVTFTGPFEWTLYAATPAGVLRSTDLYGGWTPVDGALTGGAVQALLGVGGRLFAGTATGGVSLSADEGRSWTAVNTGLSETSITALASDGVYLFAATPSGVFRRALAELDQTTGVGHGGPLGIDLAAPYPNPSTSSVSVAFTLRATGPVRLSVHDVQGRWMADLASGIHAAGIHHASWDGRERSGPPARAGVYFLRLERAGRAAERKVILLP
jgi:hypothetical protein